MKEESKLTIINNMYIPKKVIFHPTLPVILTDVGNDSIGIYEYKVSPFPTKTFSILMQLTHQLILLIG
ncbi:hypothetical protein ENUP19_0178G0012 [Entamoeba nuttalli]|uniref:Uncharacterized protein n=1 Tax=Entamoeba nuttalli TaxID=412467 RepID=A0ABQ0DMS7_9EUKA